MSKMKEMKKCAQGVYESNKNERNVKKQIKEIWSVKNEKKNNWKVFLNLTGSDLRIS